MGVQRHRACRGREVLHDRGEHVAAVVRSAQVDIGVDADDRRLGALLLDGVDGRGEERSRDGHDDVDVLVEQAERDVLGLELVVEAADEHTVLRFTVPAEQLHVCSVHVVVVLDADLEAVHEHGHRREGHAAVGADDPRRGCARGHVACQRRRLGGVEEHGLHVVEGQGAEVVVRHLAVDEGEVHRRVVLRSVPRCVGEGETDRDDEVAAFVHEGSDVARVLVLRCGLCGAHLGAHLIGGCLDALVGELIEVAVVEACEVGDGAGEEVGGWRLRVVARVGCCGARGQDECECRCGADGGQPSDASLHGDSSWVGVHRRWCESLIKHVMQGCV